MGLEKLHKTVFLNSSRSVGPVLSSRLRLEENLPAGRQLLVARKVAADKHELRDNVIPCSL